MKEFRKDATSLTRAMEASRIVLLSDSSQRIEQWRSMLAGLPHATVLVAGEAAENSTDVPCDVLVTDLATLPAEMAAGQFGIVGITPSRIGDVQLPSSVSPTELRLACRLLSEITQLRRQLSVAEHARDRWADLANKDTLTGLPNRRAWDQVVVEMPRQDRVDPLCVALFDLDLFKIVNDQSGHSAGDAVLSHVGARLRASIRDSDLACRLGGDEFGVLLPALPSAAALRTVERIRQGLVYDNAGSARRVTASAGCATGSADQLSHLIEQADLALRQAKQRGRDQTVSSAAPAP